MPLDGKFNTKSKDNSVVIFRREFKRTIQAMRKRLTNLENEDSTNDAAIASLQSDLDNLQTQVDAIPLVPLQTTAAGIATAGSVQGDATSIVIANYVPVASATAATEGTILPAIASVATGTRVVIYETTGSFSFELYPAIGEAFTGIAINTPTTVTASGNIVLVNNGATWDIVPA